MHELGISILDCSDLRFHCEIDGDSPVLVTLILG